jgi:hypothetical protein
MVTDHLRDLHPVASSQSGIHDRVENWKVVEKEVGMGKQISRGPEEWVLMDPLIPRLHEVVHVLVIFIRLR